MSMGTANSVRMTPWTDASPLKVLCGVVSVLTIALMVELGALPALHLWTVCLLLASAGFLLIGKKGKRDLLHPVRVFGSLWCFCLALGSMQLLSIISDWDVFMWSCVLTGLATFIGGFWFGNKIFGQRTIHSEEIVGEVLSKPNLLSEGKALWIGALCVLIGVVVLGYEDFLIGGIPLLSGDPDSLRMELFGGAAANPQFNSLFIKIIHVFVEFVKYGAFLAFIVLFQDGVKSKKVKFASVCIILVGTLAYFSQAGRTFFVMIAITGVVLFHYLRRPIRVAEIGAAVTLLFLFVGLFGSARVKQSQTAPLFNQALSQSRFPEGNFWDGVAFGYATTTISFEVFYRLTVDFRTMARAPGGFLFYSLHRFIPRSNLGEVANDLYSGESTTSTFLGDFYGDYGYWGVFFGPLVTGCLYGWAYSKGRRRRSLYWVYVRAMLIQVLIFFPYVNLFSLYLTWIFDLFFMYWLIRLTARDPAQPEALAAPRFFLSPDPQYGAE